MIHSAAIWSIAYSPDGKNIVSASDDGFIKIINIKSGESEIINQVKDIAGMNHISYSRDGKLISYLLNENTMIV